MKSHWASPGLLLNLSLLIVLLLSLSLQPGQLGWENMGLGSVRQDGPPYLRADLFGWSALRSFVSDIPLEERRKKFMDSEAQINAIALSHIPVSERSCDLLQPELVDKNNISWISIAYMRAVKDQVWESLIPVKKWRDKEKNLQVGDIVLLQYASKLSKPSYRYGKVIKTITDEKGLVRDVMVATRSRRRKEKPGQYIPGPMDHQLVPVRRLVLLLPKEEYDNLPGESPALHLCEEVVPGDQLLSPPPPASPTVPTTQCAPALQTSSEVAQVNSFVTFALNNVSVDLEAPYYCEDCSIRETFIFNETEI